MGAFIAAFLLLWFVCALPVAFMYIFNQQIIAILEAYEEYIRTKTRILQEVNKYVSD